MALIRQATAATMARDALVLDLGDLKRQADAVRARAQADAHRILADANAERERILHTAAEEGHAQGLARGMEDGFSRGRAQGLAEARSDLKTRLETLDQRWSDALDSLEKDRDRILLEAREDVLRLAIAMGELVAKRHISASPQAVIDQVAAALSLLSQPTRTTIRVHPDDLTLVQDALPTLAATIAAAAHAELAPDASLQPGDCILRTPSGGEIDASISAQLHRIAEALLPREGRAQEPPP
jgi:flagellar assembly protein FliH